MRIPTPDEYHVALEKYGALGPQPIAGSVDRCTEFAQMRDLLIVDLTNAKSKHEFIDCAKALLVLGISIGIHVGEARKGVK